MPIELSTLNRVRREGIAEQVVKQIVALIETGSLKAGDRLPSERKLADELGIGRPTLREALRSLSLLGILDIRHGGGIYVSSLTPDSLLGPLHLYIGLDKTSTRTIIEARKVIEGAVVAHAAATISEVDLTDLRETVRQMARLAESGEPASIKLERIHELAHAFRQTIRKAANNAILARAVESLDILSAAARSSSKGKIAESKPLLELSISHGRIVEALESHDADRSREAVVAHLNLLSGIYGAAD